jgi:hypothetical protein
VRGGLDDALERLARRDRLRRQHDQQAGGPPPAVAELVEAIADVVGRNPELALTIGVEGAGNPLLLHVAMEDGVVRVTASDPPDAPAPTERVARYDFDLEVDDTPVRPEPRHAYEWNGEPTGYDPHLARYDGHLAEDPLDDDETLIFDHSRAAAPRPHAAPPYMVPAPAGPPPGMVPPVVVQPGVVPPAAVRPAGGGTPPAVPPPAVPPAAVPPPAVPPPAVPPAAVPPPAVPPAAVQPVAVPPRGPSGMQPPPLARPVPLRVEEPEETEQAARRLAALLREDPSLLQ